MSRSTINCPSNLISVAQKDVPLSTRGDIQVRDPNTHLSIYGRGLFSWASSLLQYTPFAFLGGAISLAGCVLNIVGGVGSVGSQVGCVAGASMTLLGTAYPAWQVASAKLGPLFASLTGRNNIPADFFNGVNQNEWIALQSAAKRESKNVSTTLYHEKDDSSVTLEHIFSANKTHPLRVYHHGTFPTNNQTVTLWPDVNNATHRIRFNMGYHFQFHFENSTLLANKTLSTRQNCPSGDEQINEGQGVSCNAPQSPPPGSPTSMYYGWDLYGDAEEIDEFEDDLGTTDDATNGFVDGVINMSSDIVTKNAWDTCICQKANNQYIATGSLQMTWDETYNGYSDCYTANCDGNTTSNKK
ncbi:hypothetical protein B7463_g5948, partial [Scytalidium lignicola]